MSRFIGEAEDFLRPGEPRRLIVTDDLLDELGVAEGSRADQELAVRGWLAGNEPYQVLALSLRKDGFLAENVSNNLSNEPRRTGPDDGGRPHAETPVDLHQHGRRRTTTNPRPPGSGLITRRS